MPKLILNNVSLHFPTSKSASHKTIVSEGGPAVAGNMIQTGRGKLAIQALEDVSLALADGARLGVIGPNGSGKTTLLRVMAGIYEPNSGRVESSGKISTMFSLGLGMQSDASGYRNILLSGLVSGASRTQIRRVLPEIVEFTELSEYLDFPLRTYSQGMAMRLKFACATAFQPDILLLDEWIGAGDEDFQSKAQKRMQELLSHTGIVVLATHNVNLMRNVVDTVVWLEKGKVRMIGPTQEVLDARGAERRRLLEARAT